MKLNSLKRRIFAAFFSLIILLGACIAMLGSYVIKKNIIERAQQEVKNDLKTARSVYDSQIEHIKNSFELLSQTRDINGYQQEIGLDYLFEVNPDQIGRVESLIAKKAFKGQGAGGTRIIGKQELIDINKQLFERSKINIKPTPKAIPTDKKILDRAMAIEYAMPVKDKDQNVKKVVYGGRIINRDFALVDKIRGLVFENKLYQGKAQGTVTIFQDDVRISTNVLNDKKQRAIGTRVSKSVYNAVVKQGRMWVDRAFVVNAWYLTAYEPIKDIQGRIIGILYVGILEKPFRDTEGAIVLAFITIIGAAGVLAAVLALILTPTITNPLTKILKATSKIAGGDLQHRVDTSNSSLKEVKELAEAFNSMSGRLDERQKSLQISNQKLEDLNSNYLDLVGFVSHELKGILSSIVLNAYNLRKEFLGPMNDAQKKALFSMSRNLDYLSATVKNFLNLSRIEKDKIKLKKVKVNLKDQVFDVSIESFVQLAKEKNIQIKEEIDPNMIVNADTNLMQIVVNNLLSNAVKYGVPGGKIIIKAKLAQDQVQAAVYNDGRPIASVDVDKLFKKFSRLIYAGAEKVKGTGIGLFITRKIIEQHGGKIWVEPRENGNTFKFNIKTE